MVGNDFAALQKGLNNMVLKLKQNGDGSHQLKIGIREALVGLLLLAAPVTVSTLVNWRVATIEIKHNSTQIKSNTDDISGVKIEQAILRNDVQHIKAGVDEIKQDVKKLMENR